MKDVTYGLPADTGARALSFRRPERREDSLTTAQRKCSTGAAEVKRVGQERVTDDDNAELVDLPAVAGALAALDIALAEHGAPDPERTAAWLESEAEPVGAVLAVVPHG